ncbi:unnamed protein product [Pseudo-nitzschia multistriata]|uniref:Thioredoxin domain-containing protein n=1 Tax=Pseudo-nitzschia multistriata TaxID=183589 RepID=A0A448ZN80_9STRA|nr:unnamed protein product [Pseudo-nitzschia multistriata]
MEGDWEKLAEDYNGDSNNPESGGLLVAEVDCTDDSVAGGGKALCNWFGIESFPTLRYGERTHDGRNELQHREFDDYNGKRSYHELSVFSKEILLPMLCSPGNPDGCADDAVRDAVNEYNRLSVSELKASIKHLKEKLERAEAIYRGEVERLTADYNDAEEAKRTAIDRVASSGGDLEIARQTLFMFKKQQQQKTSRQQVKSDEL